MSDSVVLEADRIGRGNQPQQFLRPRGAFRDRYALEH